MTACRPKWVAHATSCFKAFVVRNGDWGRLETCTQKALLCGMMYLLRARPNGRTLGIAVQPGRNFADYAGRPVARREQDVGARERLIPLDDEVVEGPPVAGMHERHRNEVIPRGTRELERFLDVGHAIGVNTDGDTIVHGGDAGGGRTKEKSRKAKEEDPKTQAKVFMKRFGIV
jgi:hypothetical protein